MSGGETRKLFTGVAYTVRLTANTYQRDSGEYSLLMWSLEQPTQCSDAKPNELSQKACWTLFTALKPSTTTLTVASVNTIIIVASKSDAAPTVTSLNRPSRSLSRAPRHLDGFLPRRMKLSSQPKTRLDDKIVGSTRPVRRDFARHSRRPRRAYRDGRLPPAQPSQHRDSPAR
jgi:hypothetical protein